MDINDMRAFTTVISFALFIGLVVWAWSSRHRAAFEEAANLPFVESGIGSEGGSPARMPFGMPGGEQK
jgi:cytochrome c oxidase cbb3-type subunit 4